MSPEYKSFIALMAKKAQETSEAMGARYALGKKSVDIPLTKELINAFIAENASSYPDLQPFKTDLLAQEWAVEQGFLSAVGAKTGVFEVSLTHPPQMVGQICNTASIISLAKEMESHVSLVLNCIHKSIPTDQRTVEQEQTFSEVKDQVFKNLNREILMDQIIWLEKNTPQPRSFFRSGVRPSDLPSDLRSKSNEELSRMAAQKYEGYISKTGEKGYYSFNTYLDEQRPILGKKYREQALVQMAYKNPSLETHIENNIETINEKLTSTASSQSDALIQNSATGKFITTTGAENVSHNKRLDDPLITQRIIQDPDDNVVWRLASASATDDYENDPDAETDPSKYIVDVTRKLGALSDQIALPKNGGDPNDYVYYNLLTAYKGYNDNGQTSSADIIIAGVHALNRQKIIDGKLNLVLLCNLTVNGFGENKPSTRKERGSRKGIDEVHDLVDLSIIQMLQKTLGDSGLLNHSDQSELKTAANGSMEQYKDFLRSDDSGLYTQSEYADRQFNAINHFRKNVTGEFVNPNNRALSHREKAALVIFKMFKNGSYADKKNGMMVQALLLVAEKNKCSGCKSANERFASVLDKSVNVGDDSFVAAMDAYLIDGDEKKLYGVMTDLYAKKSFYEGGGTKCSCGDQGATSKVELNQSAATQTVRTRADTNSFEAQIGRANQDHAGKLQAKKLEHKGKVKDSMKNLSSLKEKAKNELGDFVSEIKKYNAKVKTGGTESRIQARTDKSDAGIHAETAIQYISDNFSKLNDPEVTEQINKHKNTLLQDKNTLVNTHHLTAADTTVLDPLDRAIELCDKYGRQPALANSARDDDTIEDGDTESASHSLANTS